MTEPTAEHHNLAPTTPVTQASQSSFKNSLGLPIAIVIAAALIAGAIVYTGMQKNSPSQLGGSLEGKKTAEIEVAPVSDKDHIRGNPNAPVMIVEYSDFDCPFCKNFHDTMNRIIREYGAEGKVAWVYRQFPIKQLHPNSPKVAAAAECVASIGGNDAFWKFADLAFGDRSTNEPTNISKLAEYAEQAGAERAKFIACVDAGTFTEKINNDVQAAVKAGAQGTPYSVMIVGDQQGAIEGAQQYETVKAMIDEMLKQVGQ